MVKKSKIKTVLIRGTFHFAGNNKSDFRGPIRKGFRPVVWCTNIYSEATSCSFISDVEISEGENKNVDIVVLNELQLLNKIEKGMILSIGSTIHKIGEFTVLDHLGEWHGGKVP